MLVFCNSASNLVDFLRLGHLSSRGRSSETGSSNLEKILTRCVYWIVLRNGMKIFSKKSRIFEKNEKKISKGNRNSKPEVVIWKIFWHPVDLFQYYQPAKFGGPSCPDGRENCTQSRTIFPFVALGMAVPILILTSKKTTDGVGWLWM